MKFLLSKLMIIGLLSVIVLISACTQKADSGNIKSFDGIGWVDDNTIRASGTGKPKNGETSIEKRKMQSQKMAILNATGAIIEHIQGMMILPATEDDYICNVQVQNASKQLSEILKSGTITNIRWNMKTYECFVIYEISQKNLKQRIKLILKDLGYIEP